MLTRQKEAKIVQSSRQRAGLNRRQVAERTNALISKHELFYLENGGYYSGDRYYQILDVLKQVLDFPANYYDIILKGAEPPKERWTPFKRKSIFQMLYIIGLLIFCYQPFLKFSLDCQIYGTDVVVTNTYKSFVENVFLFSLSGETEKGTSSFETESIMPAKLNHRVKFDWAIINFGMFIVIYYIGGGLFVFSCVFRSK